MADIGLSYENAKNICPPDIDIIYNMSRNTCSISGPEKSVTAFITKLQDDNIFIKEINCSNIPLHSRYLASAEATILAYLNRIIPQNVTHSQMWQISFCGTRELSYAEYFTNNLLGHALFEKTARLILKNTLTLEIAPGEILQSIVTELFETTNITLFQRHHEDNVKVFLQGLGKMYNNGLQPQLANLYPIVQFPVSRGTPMISPLIKWNHSEETYVMCFKTQKNITSGERTINITLKDDTLEYISGHVIDGRNLLPATGYLVFIWDTISMLKGQLLNDFPIVFENIKFIRATYIPKQGDVDLTLMVQKGTGNFEIIEGGNAVVTGTARITPDPAKEKIPSHFLRENCENEEEVMTTKDIYKELKLRGYQYANLFRGLKTSSTTGKQGHIAWTNNWVTFLDNLLQIKILGVDMRNLYVPTEIQKLIIDTKLHAQCIKNITSEEKCPIVPDYQHKDLVRIVYASINFKDVMLATGKIIMDEYMSRGRLEECLIGLEYVGIDSAGRKVMGIWENRCISNMRIADRPLCWYIPDEWTLEDAATVPCAYGTCCYGLYIKTMIKKSDKILIHSGTGAIGQAAIHLALHEGCEVFTTVGTPEKRKFIRKTFPSIPEDHIGNSRDTSFEQMIFLKTNGRGVDIVLNSLAEEKLQASIRTGNFEIIEG
ncbi:fatty acid synthase-like, partial [Formica exsecta]|uniref:fatty acid synthase-like n=1 Tax=Formica exsecta TaxID=72781 RepID=UPI00114403C5